MATVHVLPDPQQEGERLAEQAALHAAGGVAVADGYLRFVSRPPDDIGAVFRSMGGRGCNHEWFYAADGVRCGHCDTPHPDCTLSPIRTTMRNLSLAVGGDPDGLRSIASAKGAFVRGQIDVEEFERRVERLLRQQPEWIRHSGSLG